MEQRVRDIIESLQKFDPDTRVSEKTTLSFKYDGENTRLVVKCNNPDYEATITGLEEKIEELESDLKEARGDVDFIG